MINDSTPQGPNAIASQPPQHQPHTTTNAGTATDLNEPVYGYPDLACAVDELPHHLSDEHRQHLAESGISTEAIAARGYFTLTDPLQAKLLGYPPAQCKNLPALAIPLYNWRTERAGVVIRPDLTLSDHRGRRLKYLLPAKAAPVLDVAPLTAGDIDDPAKPVIITTGAKQADSAATRGLCSINLNGVYGYRGPNAKGGMVALPDWEYIALKGRPVFIAYDSDIATKPVESALRRLSAMLHQLGAVVKVVYLPSAPDGAKVGLDDFFADGGTVERLFSLARDLESLAESQRKKKEEKAIAVMLSLEADGLPIIETNDRQLRDKLKDLSDALAATNEKFPRLFHGDNGLVVIGLDKKGRVLLQSCDRDGLQADAGAAATWKSTSEREGTRQVTPPRDLCSAYLSRSHYWRGVPPIDGIMTAPFVAEDGSVCTTPGYNPAAKVWLELPPGLKLPCTDPTPERVEAAKSLILNGLLKDVAFVDQASRAHALELMLLPFVRRRIKGPTPLHLWDAPSQSSGKSYAAKISIAPFTEPRVSSDKNDDEEWRKSLLSALLSGRSHIFLDNIKGRLSSPMLASALTEPVITERNLGGLGEITVSVNCCWVATSNNAHLDPDTASRCVVIRVDTGLDNPEGKVYGSDPLEYIEQHRGEVIGALLTLIRHWLEAGMPAYSGAINSRFPAWQKVMGGILESIGVDGFLGNLSTYRDTLSPEKMAWCEFTKAWFEAYPPPPATPHISTFVTASQLLQLALESPEMACLLGDKGTQSQIQKLGKLLQYRRDKVFGDLKIISGIPSRTGATYALRR